MLAHAQRGLSATPRTLMWFAVVPQSFHVTVTAAWQVYAIVISVRA
jgi:hypothetical protein